MWSCNPWVLGVVGLVFGVLLAGGKEDARPGARSEEDAPGSPGDGPGLGTHPAAGTGGGGDASAAVDPGPAERPPKA